MTSQKTYVCFDWHKPGNLGAVTVPCTGDSARASARDTGEAVRRASILFPGVTVGVTHVGNCNHCGSAYDVRDGEPLVCSVCSSAFGSHRAVPSLPGKRWALVRPGTGLGLVVAVFSGPESYAREQARGTQVLVEIVDADQQVEIGWLLHDGELFGFDD